MPMYGMGMGMGYPYGMMMGNPYMYSCMVRLDPQRVAAAHSVSVARG